MKQVGSRVQVRLLFCKGSFTFRTNQVSLYCKFTTKTTIDNNITKTSMADDHNWDCSVSMKENVSYVNLQSDGQYQNHES